MIRLRTLLTLLLAVLAWPAHAQTFPALTGRVVDGAGLLDPRQAASLAAKLERIEATTGRQVVVATVTDLQGYPIEDYGYKLGRAWGIGTKGANYGAILLVSKNDRKVRIEVGYGLEPILTDAFAGSVITDLIVPRFKADDYAGGIDAGVDAIGKQIGLPPEEAAKQTQAAAKQTQQHGSRVSGGSVVFWLIIVFFVVLPLLRRIGGGGRRYRSSGIGGGIGNVILWSALNGMANSGRSSGWGGGGFGGGFGGGGSDSGGSGGGFSGGGGSFGGGGASGGW